MLRCWRNRRIIYVLSTEPPAASTIGTLMDWLKQNLTDTLKLPPDAVEWLCALFHSINFLDDVVDGDPVDRPAFNLAVWNLLYAMPQNTFFARHSHNLLPLIATQILKWQASDTAERDGRADAKSFGWRAGYYDIVLYCVAAVHGPGQAVKVAEDVLRLYGEDLHEYMWEFENA